MISVKSRSARSFTSSRIDACLASLRIVGDVESGRRESTVGRVYAYAGSRVCSARARRAARAAPSSGRAAQRPSIADKSGTWPRGERGRRRRQSRARQVRRRRDGIVSGPACEEEDDADAMPNAYATLLATLSSTPSQGSDDLFMTLMTSILICYVPFQMFCPDGLARQRRQRWGWRGATSIPSALQRLHLVHRPCD
jgi:hypothetical protein